MLRFLAMAAGLALLPPLSDAQSGVTFPGGNSMGVNIQGVEQVRVTQRGRMGISTTAPDPTAILDISTTTHGVLLPRLTTTQRLALQNPADGLLVIDTGYNALAMYGQGGWRYVGGGTSSQMTDFSKGFFVLIQSGFSNGNLGGISGANTICYNQLNNNNWLGKQDSVFAHPDLDVSDRQSRVKAFLCSNTGCQNPVASTSYYFASTSNASSGGGLAFTTDASGNAPNNATSWECSRTVGTTGFHCNMYADNDPDSGTTYYPPKYLTGRNTGTSTNFVTTAHGDRCNNWTSSSSSYNGRISTGNTGTARWSGASERCDRITNLTNSTRLSAIICMVDPL